MKTKNILWTVVCYVAAVILAVGAFFFEMPVKGVVAIFALFFMIGVAAKALLEKESWKTIVIRSTLVAGIATELSFFYDSYIGRVIFGILCCIGCVVCLGIFIFFMNSLAGEDGLDD